MAFFTILDVLTLGGVTADRLTQEDYKMQRRQIEIVYSPSNYVISAGQHYEDSKTAFFKWLSSQNPAEELDTLCTASSGGYPPAQFAEANRHFYGLWGTPRDPTKAYVWGKMSEFSGYSEASKTLETWKSVMSTTDVEAATKLFAAWNSKECE